MSSKFVDITGEVFNELKAIRVIDRKKRIWLWQCSCGKECLARKYDVISGKQKSCGHLSNRGITDTIRTGDKFNEWEVIEFVGDRKFLCRCSCGEERVVHSYDLRNGNSKSCGHLTKGTSLNGRKDMQGERIGEWSIGEYIGNGMYKCECSCGTIKHLSGTYLRTGQSKSCGHNSNAFQDLTNKKFGEWTVKRYKGNYKWECECSCGVIQDINAYDLKNNKSTNCGHKRTADLLGKHFGKLKITKYLGDNLWECECSCGNKTTGLTSNIVSGNKISCGCIVADKHEDMISLIKHAIHTFIHSNGYNPFVSDIADATGLTSTTICKYINAYNLDEYINKSFDSRPERDIYEFVRQYSNNVVLHDRHVLKGKELDIYIPDKNIAIEFNGNYWHSTEKLADKYYHQNKTIDCTKLGVQLIHIFEYEWNDLEKQTKILNYIRRMIDNDSAKPVYARNTIIRAIDSNTANEFCDKYHIQGSVSAAINYGCFYENELVGVMTFGKPRFNSNYEYEILRLCWKNNIRVVGGSQKLFSRFIADVQPNSVITYSDISKFTGNIYTKLGFEPIKPNPITEPNYMWVSQVTDNVMSRYQTQKHKLAEYGFGNHNQTEDEIMYGMNYIKIYDCGSIKLSYNRK